MGYFLNNVYSFGLYKEVVSYTYFVDKTDIFKELIPSLSSSSESRQKYLALIRPRRFGKTVMANMVSSFFSKGVDSREIFDSLKVSQYSWYLDHLNRYNVIHINFSDIFDDSETKSYDNFISYIKRILLEDLIAAYPDAKIERSMPIVEALNRVYTSYNGESFIFVLDEWDYIFHQSNISQKEMESYTKFLSRLLKDKAYVKLVYMTGILPIAKYSKGSELNMFAEYTMANEARFSEYFGFLDSEVDALYDVYLKKNERNAKVTREGLRLWYDGYHTKAGDRVYNPRSVVLSLENNNLGNYWTESGPYEEIFYYVGANVDQVREDVGLLISDIPVPAKIQEYAATSMELKTRDEIFSAMVVYGFLNYENGFVSIPNKELMGKFEAMATREQSLGNVYRLVRESERMLAATRALDAETMSEILEFAHNTESPTMFYSCEAELASVVKLVYLSARDYYRIEREDKAGIGYVDFIFYPYIKSEDAIIIELKVNATADDAISQIKEKQYALALDGKLGEKREYTGRILAVGIAYRKDDKKRRHECKVEVLRDRL